MCLVTPAPRPLPGLGKKPAAAPSPDPPPCYHLPSGLWGQVAASLCWEGPSCLRLQEAQTLVRVPRVRTCSQGRRGAENTDGKAEKQSADLSQEPGGDAQARGQQGGRRESEKQGGSRQHSPLRGWPALEGPQGAHPGRISPSEWGSPSHLPCRWIPPFFLDEGSPGYPSASNTCQGNTYSLGPTARAQRLSVALGGGVRSARGQGGSGQCRESPGRGCVRLQ